MALCKFCEKDMATADSCIAVPVSIYRGEQRKRPSKKLAPIPFGKEKRFPDRTEAPGTRCYDCNVLVGHFHHPNCDWEECPNCHRQMLMCGGDCG